MVDNDDLIQTFNFENTISIYDCDQLTTQYNLDLDYYTEKIVLGSGEGQVIMAKSKLQVLLDFAEFLSTVDDNHPLINEFKQFQIQKALEGK